MAIKLIYSNVEIEKSHGSTPNPTLRRGIGGERNERGQEEIRRAPLITAHTCDRPDNLNAALLTRAENGPVYCPARVDPRHVN